MIRKKITGFIVLVWILLIVHAPEKACAQYGSYNLPKYDHAPYHFGFLIGYNISEFSIKQVPQFNNLDSVYILESLSGSGLTIGIISNLRLGNYFDLRFNPDLSFSERKLEYTFRRTPASKDSLVTKPIESTLLQFPIDLKFKSSRVGNFRAYVLAGVKYSYDWAAKENVKNLSGNLKMQYTKISRSDYGYQFGFGMDFYLEFFKFSPEIKVYRGISNLIENDGSIYNNSMRSMTSKFIMISLTFE